MKCYTLLLNTTVTFIFIVTIYLRFGHLFQLVLKIFNLSLRHYFLAFSSVTTYVKIYNCKFTHKDRSCSDPRHCISKLLNPLMGTLKFQSNGPLYSNTVIGTLGGLLCLVHEEGPGRAAASPSLLLAVPNITTSVSTSCYSRCYSRWQ